MAAFITLWVTTIACLIPGTPLTPAEWRRLPHIYLIIAARPLR